MILHIEVATLFHRLGDTAKVKELFGKAETLVPRNQSHQLESLLLISEGLIFVDHGKIPMAFDLFNRGLNMCGNGCFTR